MNLKLVLDDTPNLTVMTGGGYAVTDVMIHIDKSLDEHTQTEILLHEILDAYLTTIPHDKIDELTGLLTEGLDLLHGEQI